MIIVIRARNEILAGRQHACQEQQGQAPAQLRETPHVIRMELKRLIVAIMTGMSAAAPYKVEMFATGIR